MVLAIFIEIPTQELNLFRKTKETMINDSKFFSFHFILSPIDIPVILYIVGRSIVSSLFFCFLSFVKRNERNERERERKKKIIYNL